MLNVSRLLWSSLLFISFLALISPQVTRIMDLRGFFRRLKSGRNIKSMKKEYRFLKQASTNDIYRFLNLFEETMVEGTSELSRMTLLITLAARHVFNLACYRLLEEYVSTSLLFPDQSVSRSPQVPFLGSNGLQDTFQKVLSGLRDEKQVTTLSEQQKKFFEVVPARELNLLVNRFRSKPSVENILQLFKLLVTGWYKLAMKYCDQEPKKQAVQQRCRKQTPSVVDKRIEEMLCKAPASIGHWLLSFRAAAQRAKANALQCLSQQVKMPSTPPPVMTLSVAFREDLKDLLSFAARCISKSNPSAQDFLSKMRLPLGKSLPVFLNYLDGSLEWVKKLFSVKWRRTFAELKQSLNNLPQFLPQLARQLAVECRNKVLQGIRELASRFWKLRFEKKKVPPWKLDQLMDHVFAQDVKGPPKDQEVKGVLDALFAQVQGLPRSMGNELSDECALQFYLCLFKYLKSQDQQLATSFLLLPQTKISHAPIVLMKGDVLYNKVFEPLLSKLRALVADPKTPETRRRMMQAIIKELNLPGTIRTKQSKALQKFAEFFANTKPLHGFLESRKGSFSLAALRSDGLELQFLLERKGEKRSKGQLKTIQPPRKKGRKGLSTAHSANVAQQPCSQGDYRPYRHVAVDPGVRSIVKVSECMTLVFVWPLLLRLFFSTHHSPRCWQCAARSPILYPRGEATRKQGGERCDTHDCFPRYLNH